MYVTPDVKMLLSNKDDHFLPITELLSTCSLIHHILEIFFLLLTKIGEMTIHSQIKLVMGFINLCLFLVKRF